MRQCDNGHFYDESRFDSCPYCQERRRGRQDGCGRNGREDRGCCAGRRCAGADRGKTVGIIKKRSVLILQ